MQGLTVWETTLVERHIYSTCIIMYPWNSCMCRLWWRDYFDPDENLEFVKIQIGIQLFFHPDTNFFQIKNAWISYRWDITPFFPLKKTVKQKKLLEVNRYINLGTSTSYTSSWDSMRWMKFLASFFREKVCILQ